MPVIGLTLGSIEANKSEEVHGEIKVNNKINATSVKEKDLPGLGHKGLSIEFKFLSAYSVGDKTVAEIKMSGEVLYIGDECKEILKQWKKDGTIPEEHHIDIINTVFRKCISKVIVLAEDIQLPPPIGLPFAQKPKKE